MTKLQQLRPLRTAVLVTAIFAIQPVLLFGANDTVSTAIPASSATPTTMTTTANQTTNASDSADFQTLVSHWCVPFTNMTATDYPTHDSSVSLYFRTSC